MSFTDPNHPAPDLRVTVALILFITGAFAFLAYGPGLDSAYSGIGALLAIPFALGALITQSTRFYSLLGCLGAPILLLVLSIALASAGLEGLICVAMVMPFWLAAGAGGGLVTLWYRRSAHRHEADVAKEFDDDVTIRSVGLAALPFALIFAELVVPPAWEHREVSRSLVVDAPVSRVWPLLLSIPDIRPGEGIPTTTHDWLNVPRPSGAQVINPDGAPVRLARWGADIRFEEHIETVEQGRAIGWRFSFADDSLRRFTDRHISPDGPMLKIESGGYRLQPLATGATRVTLTTRYRMRSRLSWYFAWWGERLLGDVSENVLAIIRARAESA